VLVLLRQAGLWLGDGIVWPAALVVLGSAVIWTRGDEATRAKWLARMPSWIREEDESRPRIRTLVGALVIALGAWAFLSSNPPLDLFDNAPLAVATVVVGLAVIAGPGIWRLVRQASHVRSSRAARSASSVRGCTGRRSRAARARSARRSTRWPSRSSGRTGRGSRS